MKAKDNKKKSVKKEENMYDGKKGKPLSSMKPKKTIKVM